MNINEFINSAKEFIIMYYNKFINWSGIWILQNFAIKQKVNYT